MPDPRRVGELGATLQALDDAVKRRQPRAHQMRAIASGSSLFTDTRDGSAVPQGPDSSTILNGPSAAGANYLKVGRPSVRSSPRGPRSAAPSPSSTHR